MLPLAYTGPSSPPPFPVPRTLFRLPSFLVPWYLLELCLRSVERTRGDSVQRTGSALTARAACLTPRFLFCARVAVQNEYSWAMTESDHEMKKWVVRFNK